MVKELIEQMSDPEVVDVPHAAGWRHIGAHSGCASMARPVQAQAKPSLIMARDTGHKAPPLEK